jgi:sialate O-acetylesterase
MLRAVGSFAGSFVVALSVAFAVAAPPARAQAPKESEQKTQGNKPEAWWPTQPRPLPLVHPLFSNDMVLQRDIAAPIWGWTKPGNTVIVTFDHRAEAKATAGADGRWSAKIGPFSAGGPHELEIGTRGDGEASRGGERVKLKNVLVGDVWLCSGQSNMNWPVRLAKDGAKEAETANNPRIRSFTVSFYPSLIPQKLPPPAKWEVCTPEFAKNFSGVGYFFARELEKTQRIPIGIIHSSVGATYAETWVSAEALRAKMPNDFPALLDEVAQWAGPKPEKRDYFADVERWVAAVDPEAAKLKNATSTIASSVSEAEGWRDAEVPKAWEESGLPNFDGFVWFRRTLDLPEDYVGHDLRLQLGAIKDVDVAWFNGTLIGATQVDGIRRYTVPRELLKAGANTLTVAVLNRQGPGGFVGAPPHMAATSLKPNAGPSLKLAGGWQMRKSTALADIKQPFPEPPLRNYKTITSMYNGMIAPLVPFGIKGALWYQGEANGPRWKQYRTLLPTLIGDWRARFDCGDFPFLIVSLANYNPLQKNPVEPGWAEIRESQWRIARTVPNAGLAMTIDIGDGGDIHPRNKQEVGRRLSLVARRMTYGEKDLVDSGPEFVKAEPDAANKSRMRLHFTNLGGGLAIRAGDAKLTGFAIAGEDKTWHWADAVIDGDTIVVSSAAVPEPKHVRYGWAWNPLVNLYNKAGLPAITFRSDE